MDLKEQISETGIICFTLSGWLVEGQKCFRPYHQGKTQYVIMVLRDCVRTLSSVCKTVTVMTIKLQLSYIEIGLIMNTTQNMNIIQMESYLGQRIHTLSLLLFSYLDKGEMLKRFCCRSQPDLNHFEVIVE